VRVCFNPSESHFVTSFPKKSAYQHLIAANLFTFPRLKKTAQMKYVLFTFTIISISLCSCLEKPKHNKAATATLQNQPLDTIQSNPATISAQPALLETAFIKGTKNKIKNLEFTLYGINIGKIKITSGYIVACDPFLIDQYGHPFTQQFPTGEFPIQLSIAYLEKKGETVAMARIKFSDEPVAKWEYALLEGQKKAPIGQGDDIGYVVDAGYGIFVDKNAIDSLPAKELAKLSRDIYKQINQKYSKGWSADMYSFGNDDNLAAFTSGFGDGRYASYVGFDSNGKPCRLVTDFALFDLK
jgi:hypothetical protein